jgi:FAD/FMN-containing dehydrogenase
MQSGRPNKEPLVAPREMEHHVADLSATYAANVTLAAAQAKLRENGQWLPIDGDPEEFVGSLVERNSTGPMRLGFGGWRDLLLGAQFVNGTGELITAGGRTVKNVAGYDLTKFMVGQYGVFGKLVTITTRAYKAPDFAMLATFPSDVRKVGELLVTPCRPQWAMLTSEALLCGYLGDRATVDYYEQQVPQRGASSVQRRSLEEDIADRAARWKAAKGQMSFRASVPPAKLPEFVKEIPNSSWSADAAFGIAIGSCETASQEKLQAAAKGVGGGIIFFGEDGKPLPISVNPQAAALLDRLKTAFDPSGRLSPLSVKAT